MIGLPLNQITGVDKLTRLIYWLDFPPSTHRLISINTELTLSYKQQATEFPMINIMPPSLSLMINFKLYPTTV